MSTSCATLPSSVKLELFGSRTSARLHPHRSRCGLSRRHFAFKGIVAAGVSVMASSAIFVPGYDVGLVPSCSGLEKLPFKPEGYNYWTWRDRKIHYVVEGEGFPIVLIHGFGASAFMEVGLCFATFQLKLETLSKFHVLLQDFVEYNIPVLAKNYKVYAVDLLGFGWSEKALIEYDALVWRDQVVDFMKESMTSTPNCCFSLGGFTALVAAASLQDQVKGVVLLNTAGQFGDASTATTESEQTVLQKFVVKPLKEIFQRVVLGFLFWQAKQPSRIESVLKSVYINAANVDDYLIDSITRPADDPNAGEVYYRLMTRFMSNQRKYTLDSVLGQLSCPLLLVWGDLDPWVGPAKALRIKEFYPNTSLVNLQAGHCPHDEVPELVNKALLDWLPTVTSAPSLQPL
ncbi:UNVERIFIED_CONTAM: Pheophytinase, chloroplastic [Sesamum calycinum]|uniref:Pheophytinase, chloroplastic n=1 Tax=Sesamum calycinum TaxID=2727403 RepID=A0AAW2MPP9_9LAMI